MRTTVTLDPDVEVQLRAIMRERDLSFKDALNSVLRAGLSVSGKRKPSAFVQKTYSLGGEQHFRWDKALSVSEAIADEEVNRKLAMRK